MAKLNSPVDVSMFQSFAKQNEHQPGEPVWEVMKMMGTDLVSYVVNLRSRMNLVAEHEEIWELGIEDQSMKVAFVLHWKSSY